MFRNGGAVDNQTSDLPPILRMEGISKRFQAVHALDRVNLTVRSGEIHALLGGNGAGKSTLLRILSGLTAPDEGQIFFQGQEVTVDHPSRAQQLGISMIHQELSIIPDLTVLENIFLGQQRTITGSKTKSPWLNRRDIAKRVQEFTIEFGITQRELWAPAGELGSLKKRAIEIIKALVAEPKILILDEPTSGLEEQEKQLLFEHMQSLQRRGVALIWVTHHLDEIFGLAENATIMQDGKTLQSVSLKNLTVEKLISLMFGSEAAALVNQPDSAEANGSYSGHNGKVSLEVSNLSRVGVLKDISFILHESEIIGIAGLAGAGRSELARAIMGIDEIDSGSIKIAGLSKKIDHPKKAYELGLALIPEDRKTFGILSEFSVERNITLAKLNKVTKLGLIIGKNEAQISKVFVHQLKIKTPHLKEKIRNLSGGNQQKVIISRCLNAEPNILIFDEPTQGIDVSAKVEVHRVIRKLAESGKSVIVIASELNELIGLSDRILVLREGALRGEISDVASKVQTMGYIAVEQEILHSISKVSS